MIGYITRSALCISSGPTDFLVKRLATAASDTSIDEAEQLYVLL